MLKDIDEFAEWIANVEALNSPWLIDWPVLHMLATILLTFIKPSNRVAASQLPMAATAAARLRLVLPPFLAGLGFLHPYVSSSAANVGDEPHRTATARRNQASNFIAWLGYARHDMRFDLTEKPLKS